MKPERHFKCGTLFLLTLLFLLNLAHLVKAQSFVFEHRRKRVSLPFKIVKNLLIVEMTLNGKGPYNFILDTGVGMALITDPSLLDSLTIKDKRDIKIMGLGDGTDLRASVTPSVLFNITPSIYGNIPAAFLKEDIFDLSGFTGMHIHGLIGYEFFNSFIVKISYANRTLTLYKNETAYIPKKGSRVPISVEERKPYLNAEITLDGGRKVNAKLIIDTGAGHPLSLETENGIPFEVPAAHVPANLGVGLAGPISGYIARIPEIKIGKYQLKDVVTSFPNYTAAGSKVVSVGRNGNLGNNILKRFDVVFDYNRETMYLRPSMYYKEPFEHDMSGMELISAGSDLNRLIIGRVEKNSAADESGLEEGDEILSINFKSVGEMNMEDITALFRSKDDRSFILEIIPHGSKNRERVILTLKKRI
ncbi:aspartyl protease family protein [Rubrolithibacter danxiaensis]|uniref:aspartyl protease family protein n=1 Tax=Rubrolithibacter danxiaensis TaxID=3390805 RepID=UPI003BF85D0B